MGVMMTSEQMRTEMDADEWADHEAWVQARSELRGDSY